MILSHEQDVTEGYFFISKGSNAGSYLGFESNFHLFSVPYFRCFEQHLG